jgi:hypothetical protein
MDIKKIGPVLFLGIIIFLVIPIEIIRNNYLEFGSPIRPLLYALALLLIFILSNSLVLSFLRKEKISEAYVIVLFYIGVFILISDLISPLLIGIIEKGNETPVEATQGMILEFILLIGLLVLAIKSSAQFVVMLSWILSAVLFSVQIVLASTLILSHEYSSEESRVVSHDETLFEGNIYHFTFDEYSSVFFPLAVKALSLENEFEGFDFYTNARTNYLTTNMSVPSFMTGRLFTGDGHLKEWLDRTSENSIVARLKTLGFKTTFYSPYNHSWYFPADKVVQTPPSMSSLADLSLLRLVPTIFRQEVYSEGKGMISRLLSEITQSPQGDSYRALKQLEHLLETEKYRSEQKEYVYSHYFLPHPPNALTRYGDYAPNQSSFQEEILLATYMMVRFIKKLKELGKFDSSLIIIQADHGTGWSTSLAPTNIERTKPLLLVKTPQSKGRNIRLVPDLVQLVDLYQAIVDEVSPEKGATDSSPHANFLPATETVNTYQVYGHRKKPGGKIFVLGKHYSSGKMNSISIDSDGVRKDNSPIDVEW